MFSTFSRQAMGRGNSISGCRARPGFVTKAKALNSRALVYRPSATP